MDINKVAHSTCRVSSSGGGGELPYQNTQLPPPPPQRKEKGREKGERGSVYVFRAMIYLITLRLAEYHRLKSIIPQCTKFNVKLVVIGGTIHSA